MTTSPFLSICIPTRNRAALLRELLESIAAQENDEIEIVLSDDGSTDETPGVVAAFEKRFSHFTYERHDPPLLYDRNVLHVVSRARGTFCWLFSDDDRMEPGAMVQVLDELRSDPACAGFTVGRIAYNFSLTEHLPVRPLQTTQSTTRQPGTPSRPGRRRRVPIALGPQHPADMQLGRATK